MCSSFPMMLLLAGSLMARIASVSGFSTGAPACFNDEPWHFNTQPQPDTSNLGVSLSARLNPSDPDEIFVTLGRPGSPHKFKGFRVVPRIYDPDNNG